MRHAHVHVHHQEWRGLGVLGTLENLVAQKRLGAQTDNHNTHRHKHMPGTMSIQQEGDWWTLADDWWWRYQPYNMAPDDMIWMWYVGLANCKVPSPSVSLFPCPIPPLTRHKPSLSPPLPIPPLPNSPSLDPAQTLPSTSATRMAATGPQSRSGGMSGGAGAASHCASITPSRPCSSTSRQTQNVVVVLVCVVRLAKQEI